MGRHEMAVWRGRWVSVALLCLLIAGCATAPTSLQPLAGRFVHGTAPAGLAYSPDGRWVVGVRPHYNDVQVLDAKSMQVRHTLKGTVPASSIAIAGVAFAGDGNTAAIVGLDDELTIWDTSTWTEIRRFAGAKGVTGAVFLDSGRQIASVGPDRVVRLWDVDTGAERARMEGHEAPVIAIAVSPDGKMIATGGLDRRVVLWDVERRERLSTFEGHSGAVLSLAFAPDGKTLASSADGSDVLLWRLNQSPPAAVHLLDPKAEAAARDRAQAIAQVMLLISAARTYSLTGAPGGALVAAAPSVRINCPIAFSPDGRRLAIIHFRIGLAFFDYHLEVYDVMTLQRLSRYSGAIHSLAFSPDSKVIATSGFTRAFLVDPESGQELK